MSFETLYTYTQIHGLPSVSLTRSESEGGGGGGGGEGGGTEEYDIIVAPPDIFSGGDNCATPTPGDFLLCSPGGGGGGGGCDSGTSTPRYQPESPCVDTLPSKASPLATYLLKAEKPTERAAKTQSPSQLAVSLQRSDEPPTPTDHPKLSIAPRDSQTAAATSRILSKLSSRGKVLGRGSAGVAEVDGSSVPLLRRGVSEGSESTSSYEGTDM